MIQEAIGQGYHQLPDGTWKKNPTGNEYEPKPVQAWYMRDDHTFLVLPLERRNDLGRHGLGDPVGDFRIESLGGKLFLERSDDHSLVGLFGRAGGDHRDRFVEHEVGRDHAYSAVVGQSLGLAIYVARISVDAVSISERIFRAFDGVAGVEKIGHVDKRAAELVHDIWRVAIAGVRIDHQGIAERESIAGPGELKRLLRNRTVKIVGLGQIVEVVFA